MNLPSLLSLGFRAESQMLTMHLLNLTCIWPPGWSSCTQHLFPSSSFQKQKVQQDVANHFFFKSHPNLDFELFCPLAAAEHTHTAVCLLPSGCRATKAGKKARSRGQVCKSRIEDMDSKEGHHWPDCRFCEHTELRSELQCHLLLKPYHRNTGNM